jgi:phenylalanyl-tRNA synthetase alpha chain
MQEKKDKGHKHPISQMINEINTIFYKMGFEFASGPEIETEYYNFDALNVPKEHPARDMQDTFWLKEPKSEVTNNKQQIPNTYQTNQNSKTKKFLLRTHTSPVQIRYMENNKPPIRIIVPGKCYRNEATDATHEVQFHQIEGLMIDKGITLGHLRGVLAHFFKELFGQEIEIRFRPGYFPFVEPGVEVDMRFGSKKGDQWLEVFGAGMVHPNVLRAGNIDPSEYSGFAFGGGIERLLMIRHGIPDIRLFHSADLRFVSQF